MKLIDVYPPDRSNPERRRCPKLPRPPGGPSHIDDVRAAARRAGPGYQQLVRGEPFRGRFRHGFEKARFGFRSRPGRGGRTSPMPDINHTFRRGHRIMVQVQSSWFPLIDRNPQTFLDIPNARPEDFQAATQRVYRSELQPSRALEVSVLPQPAMTSAPSP